MVINTTESLALASERQKGYLTKAFIAWNQELRHQTGQISDSLAKHESNSSLEQLWNWRAVLTEVAILSRFHLPNSFNGCVDQNCDWWLRATKLKSCNRFEITKYRNIHSCGAQHLTSHHPHASADVIAEYIQPNYLNGKGPSTKDIKNIVQADLGCKISYWKCWKSSEIAKAMIRGTPEHGYAVLDGYRHMLMTINEGSKTSLKLDDKGRFKYFFASYGAWIRGFVHMRKVLAVDGTFLRGRYDGVLLSAVAQDTENHVFPVAFCVVDKECDAAYEYFFEKLLDIVPDTSELCIISDRHPSIEKTLSKFYSEAYHGCCTRHLGENARKNFHCGAFLGHYYHATKAYRRDVFHDHFEQIRIINAEVADYLENVGFHKWSRAYFPGNRYDVLTSNIVESVNAMFKSIRRFLHIKSC
ncbi:uncharacterized protein [Solanum tuberosum]|uniref:uncharacterized protein n=1 Tax=Solanum tuberosum TaxID=4113 RepID=UPI00073A50FA|nr:PREDICTED: uncharacterized protein LOC102592925 [Solanum tuberosum]